MPRPSLRLATLCAVLPFLCAAGAAQSYTFTRLAGMPTPVGTDDGVGTTARFNRPGGLAIDGNGTLYVADVQNHAIRKITPAGVVTTIAGKPGVAGTSDGTGAAAQFNEPWGLAVDRFGTIWVSDYRNHTIRQISRDGVVTTFAGEPGVSGSSDGTGRSAHFNNPVGIAVDNDGNVYVADRGNSTIRKITSAGVVTTLAGLARTAGAVDGSGSNARFFQVAGMGMDPSGNLFVADSGAQTVRKVTPSGVVTTYAGTAMASGSSDGLGSGARFYGLRGLGVGPDGTVYIADSYNECIRKLVPDGTVTTLAGYPLLIGGANGTGSTARFNFPTSAVADASGNVYVADCDNHSIRKITPAGVVSVLAGGGGNFGSADGSSELAQFNAPTGIALATDGSAIVTDVGNYTVRKIDASGTVTTLAGNAGLLGYVDGELATSRFALPYGVAADSSGSIWVSDSVFNVIRRINTQGTIRTYSGTASVSGGSIDGGPSVAQYYRPRGIAIDAAGTVYVADSGNHTIRRISAVDGSVTTYAGSPGVPGSSDGVGASARFNQPDSVAVGPDGTVYVADTGNSTIRKISTARAVTTMAGTPGLKGSADGQGGAATFRDPSALCVDAAGSIFVTDTSNCVIRKITSDGKVTTIGGTAGVNGRIDGTGSAARFYYPTGITIDAKGTLYIVDSFNNAIVRGTLDATPAFVTQPQSVTVRPGATASLAANATGGGLSYQWQFNGKALPGATNSTLTLTKAQTSDAGSYSVAISNSAGTASSANAEVRVNPNAQLGHISNLAIRSQAGSGAQTLIVGFSIGGNGTSGNKSLLIRGIGPTLGGFGVPGTMTDPKLEVYSTSTIGSKLNENNDWAGNPQVTTVGASVGAFPFSSTTSKDAALYSTTFASGGYTANVSGNDGGTGVAMAEIWDATPPDTFKDSTLRFTNVSARTKVGVGADVLIAGFVISGETSVTVLIRSVGSTLAKFGITGTLADPKLQLFSGNSVIAENDNWNPASVPAGYDAIGGNKLAATDAALLVTLSPGNYTVQVSGVQETTGIALVELYEMP